MIISGVVGSDFGVFYLKNDHLFPAARFSERVARAHKLRLVPRVRLQKVQHTHLRNIQWFFPPCHKAGHTTFYA